MNAWFRSSAPIVGLAPMDGVTDPPFRAVVDNIGHPDVLFTEFVAADGLVRSVPALFRTFTTHETKTPIVGQIFGKNPETMAQAALMLRPFNVAGIDINMGCPARHVASHGGGAGLIKTPETAQNIIRAVKLALTDDGWNVPVSVKTRIGFDKPITREWISAIAESGPDCITIHGRTLKQMYTGRADWDQIGEAADTAEHYGIPAFGNGDIHSRSEAEEKCRTYGLAGVLIGRAAMGNPWVFLNHSPSASERIDAALLHLAQFETLTPNSNVLTLRKHMAWYVSGFPDASEKRSKLVQITTVSEARTILTDIRSSIS